MTAKMILVVERGQREFVGNGVAFEFFDALFDGFSEARADFEDFVGLRTCLHGATSGRNNQVGYFFEI
uniref:Uncharacterized protein n=1 Tax=mine drainage metagenome TaxID=410659 RepID=E6QL15_9ZZZZ